MVPVCSIMYEERESAGSYVLLTCQRLFDGWPKLSLQSAATSAQHFAKFSWTISLNESNTERTCVISTQSDLNRAANYWLMAVLPIPHKGNGFFSPHTFVSFCSRLGYITQLSRLTYIYKELLWLAQITTVWRWQCHLQTMCHPWAACYCLVSHYLLLNGTTEEV